MKIASASIFPELAAFVAATRRAYEGRLDSIYVFGSRARGENRPDSDYDLAVVVADPHLVHWQEQDRLADIAYDSMLAHGLQIQAVPFTLDEWNAETTARDLVKAARKDARQIAGAM